MGETGCIDRCVSMYWHASSPILPVGFTANDIYYQYIFPTLANDIYYHYIFPTLRWEENCISSAFDLREDALLL